MSGYIKLFRAIEQWEWYTDTNTKALFLHCLIKANHRPKRWRGIVVEKGSFVTSTLKLCEELHFSRQVVRTSLERLKSTNEITIKTTNRFTVISVVKWGDYQSDEDRDNQQNNQLANQQVTNKQPTNNQQITTTKNNKNEKNIKNSIKDPNELYTTREALSEYSGLSLTEAYTRIRAKPFTTPLTEEEKRIVREYDRQEGTHEEIQIM